MLKICASTFKFLALRLYRQISCSGEKWYGRFSINDILYGNGADNGIFDLCYEVINLTPRLPIL